MERIFSSVEEAEKFRSSLVKSGLKTRMTVTKNYVKVFWTEIKKAVDNKNKVVILRT